jgi:hypothetical protein
MIGLKHRLSDVPVAPLLPGGVVVSTSAMRKGCADGGQTLTSVDSKIF